ncbi:MAG: vitamin B12-dependent ribonucleotide reductase, partial [Bacteroidota bacterium]|nr:vitamin B12-dependent ribonucleotide reductase [Bacteroidota bacterium]
ALGYSDEQVEAANDYVCGTMTIEGAPLLKPEHLPVFDCANRCGKKGERYIHAHGHIRMMAAAQPFISGAISKTINLPHEAQIEEIADSYLLSWQLGLKACALYRDGSKLSQPLSNKSDKKKKDDSSQMTDDSRKTDDRLKVTDERREKIDVGSPSSTIHHPSSESTIVDMAKLTIDELLEEVQKRVQASPDTQLKRKLASIVERRALPAKRRGFTQKAKINGQTIFLRTGEYADQTLGEIFIDMAKEGATMRSMLNCFAIAVSIGLQYGVPLDEYVEKFVFTKFDPAGFVEHPNIKSATSIVDFIFRLLGYEYLNRTDLVHVLDKPELTNLGNEPWDLPAGVSAKADDVEPLKAPELSSVRVVASTPQSIKAQASAIPKNGNGMQAVNVAAKSMQSDAPACNTCGHITIRSGTCYKCLNCGNSMGCS